MRRLLPILLMVFLATASAGASDISVSQALDKSQLAFEDSATFEIILEWPGPQYAYRFDRPLDPTFERLKVTGFSSSIKSTGTGADEVTRKSFRYTLVPTLSGTGRIEPAVISFLSYPDSIPGELMTEPMTVTIAEPIPVPPEAGLPVLWIVVILLVVAGGGLAVFLFVRKTRRVDVGEKVLSPEEIVLEQLETLKTEAGPDFKKFQSGLYRILSGYFQGRFDIDTEPLEDEVLAERIAKLALPDAYKGKLAQWTINARQDKFRPVEAAPGEALRLESEVRETFEKMKLS